MKEYFMQHGNMRCYPSGRKKSFNAWTTKKKPQPKFVPMEVVNEPYRRSTPVYQSVDCGTVHTTKEERSVYTGTLVKGISTMHKSNMVPIINDQEAKDHASMRR